MTLIGKMRVDPAGAFWTILTAVGREKKQQKCARLVFLSTLR